MSWSLGARDPTVTSGEGLSQGDTCAPNQGGGPAWIKGLGGSH